MTTETEKIDSMNDRVSVKFWGGLLVITGPRSSAWFAWCVLWMVPVRVAIAILEYLFK